jgi:aconitate hydratase
VGMGILPLTFINDESFKSLGINGTERVTILLDPENIVPNQEVIVQLSSGKAFIVKSNLKTDVEITYFKNGGILPFVLRQQVK